jgi:hypothetical protein
MADSAKQRLFKLISGTPDTPHRLALTFALGILLGVLPGTGAIVAAGVATAMQLSVPLAVAGALVTNPLTAPLVYGASYLIGRWMLGDQVVEHVILRIGLTTIAGNAILALAMAVVGYAAVLALATRYQALRRRHAPRH